MCYATGVHQPTQITSLVGDFIHCTEYTRKHDGQPGHLSLQLVLAESLHHQLKCNNSL